MTLPPSRNLAVLPARGGSGRIPDKNIRPLLGRPMLAYPLAAAAASGLFETIHVSTDSPRYAALAGELGHPVSFLRPAALAQNSSSLMELLRWTVGRYDALGQVFETICLIYATAVLIEAEDLRAGYRQLRHSPELGPVMTVGRTLAPVERALRVGADGVLRWIEPANRFLHSQQCPPAYFDAAGFLFFTRAQLFADDDTVADAFQALVLPSARVCDINDPEDLETARVLLLGRQAAALSGGSAGAEWRQSTERELCLHLRDQ